MIIHTINPVTTSITGMLTPARIFIHVGTPIPTRMLIHIRTPIPTRLLVRTGMLVPTRMVVGCGVGSGFGRIAGVSTGPIDIVPTPLWARPVTGPLVRRIREISIRFLPRSIRNITSRLPSTVTRPGSMIIRHVVLIRRTPRPRPNLRLRRMTRSTTVPARRATMMPRRPTMRGSTPMPGPTTAGMRSGTAIVSKMSTHRSPHHAENHHHDLPHQHHDARSGLRRNHQPTRDPVPVNDHGTATRPFRPRPAHAPRKHHSCRDATRLCRENPPGSQ